MSKLGERLAKRSNELHHFEIEEWGEDDEPLIIYHHKFTAGEMNRVQKKHSNFLSNPTLEAFVDIIILKALDKDGEKLFDIVDKPVLMREQIGVISRAANGLMAGTDTEELEKN